MGYRSRYEIIADMLNVVSGRAKKTKIMYQANLSYKLLQKYLAEDQTLQSCHVRAKGALLHAYRQGKRIFASIQRIFKTCEFC